MNKHTKMAVLIAPVLAIGAYIASDFYLAHQADQAKVIQLSIETSCDVLASNCVLANGEFKASVYDEQGKTTIRSTWPLDSGTLFLVDSSDQASAYPLQMSDSPYVWFSETPLRDNITAQGDTHKMRLILKIKGGQYISEFYTQNGG
jgi:hypothetical protein